jgi:hypothetical protein
VNGFKVKYPPNSHCSQLFLPYPLRYYLFFCDHAADKERQVVSSSFCAYCASVAHEICTWVHFWSEGGNFRAHREGETKPFSSLKTLLITSVFFQVDLALEIYWQHIPPSGSAKIVHQVTFPVPAAKPSVFHSKIVSQEQSPSLLHHN